MYIVFKKIPKLAIIFYCIGFAILTTALYLYFYTPNLLEPAVNQQIFIGGAIIVALGSVINNIYQFKSKKKRLK